MIVYVVSDPRFFPETVAGRAGVNGGLQLLKVLLVLPVVTWPWCDRAHTPGWPDNWTEQQQLTDREAHKTGTLGLGGAEL
ncbi:hypothetical protein ElyMa_005547000 [Elysia marginata]|uniref:Uncharacterized protein n=1 Tax=Elysia marginata TaxID=1093978 RepID=A0AAV4EZM3_9GAST|nr:hypothetical protein ElyMa_005547000 [Elysia marginata]